MRGTDRSQSQWGQPTTFIELRHGAEVLPGQSESSSHPGSCPRPMSGLPTHNISVNSEPSTSFIPLLRSGSGTCFSFPQDKGKGTA